MLTYNLSAGKEPLYQKLYQNIKKDITSGKLSANEKLPSRRALSENLGISTVTVDNAYDQLMDEGYIYALPKKGYFVSDISLIAPAKAEASAAKVSDKKSSKSATKPQKAQKDQKGQKVPKTRKEEYTFDFSSNKPDQNSFPFSIWTKLMRENLSERKEELLSVSFCAGVYELRSAIASYLASFRGIYVSPDRVIIGAGTEYLYALLIKLLGKDKKYCIENPGYRKLAMIYEQEGVEYCFAEMDKDGILISDLIDKNPDVAHISPNHHFPTGITMPIARRSALLNWAMEDNDRYIIEDDYDSEFRYRGAPIPPLMSIDKAGKVIYMNTFSKSLASTIRISYMVLPEQLADRFYETLAFYSCTVSTFDQYTLADFIEKGYFEKHINRMRLKYKRKREEAISIIRKGTDASYAELIENESGLYFILKLKSKYSDSEIKEKLKAHKIKISAISDYYMDDKDTEDDDTEEKNLDVKNLEDKDAENKKSAKESQGRFIVDYSNINLEELVRAVEIVNEVLAR